MARPLVVSAVPSPSVSQLIWTSVTVPTFARSAGPDEDPYVLVRALLRVARAEVLLERRGRRQDVLIVLMKCGVGGGIGCPRNGSTDERGGSDAHAGGRAK
jgi:hypothetical protein